MLLNKLDFSHTTAGVLVLINFILIAFVLWMSTFGFDLSDESFYSIGYQYAKQPFLNGADPYLIVYKKLFGALNFSLTNIRILRILLSVLSTVVLYLGVKNYFPKHNQTDKAILFNALLTGSLLSFTLGPLALSYNTMSAILLSLIVGCWLILLKAKKDWVNYSLAVAVGCLFVLLGFNKITNLALLPLIYAATVVFYCKKFGSDKKILTQIAFFSLLLLLGAILMLAYLSNGFGNIIAVLKKFYQYFIDKANNDPSHNFSDLLLIYYYNVKWLVKKMLLPIAIVTVAFIAQYILFKAKSTTKKVGQYLGIIIGVVTFLIIVVKNYYYRGGGGSGSVYQIILGYVFIGYLALLQIFTTKKQINIYIVLGLFSLPLIGALGTNNGLAANVLFYGSFIFLLIYYLLSTSKINWYKHGLTMAICLLAASQIVTAVALYPYRQTTSTKMVSKVSDVTFLKDIQLNTHLHNLKQQLREVKNHKAEYIFTLSHQTGMILLSNKKPYSLAWFNEIGLLKMESEISNSTIPMNNVIFILTPDFASNVEFTQMLARQNISLSNDFSLLKTVKYFDPVINRQNVLQVYVPN